MIEVAGDRLRVAGPVTMLSAATLKPAGEAAVAAGAAVIDLGGVTEADSAALAVLFAWLRTAQQAGRPLSIISAPDSLRTLATLYGVADLLPLS